MEGLPLSETQKAVLSFFLTQHHHQSANTTIPMKALQKRPSMDIIIAWYGESRCVECYPTQHRGSEGCRLLRPTAFFIMFPRLLS